MKKVIRIATCPKNIAWGYYFRNNGIYLKCLTVEMDILYFKTTLTVNCRLLTDEN